MSSELVLDDDQRIKLYEMQLKQVYESTGAIYAQVSQWLTFLFAVWGALLTVGATLGSGVAVFAGGIALLAAAYEMTRGGRVMGALLANALSLEKALGLSHHAAISPGFVLSFREDQYLKDLEALSAIDDRAEWEKRISDGFAFSVWHPKRSNTLVALIVVGVLQVVVALGLVLLGHLSL